MVPWEKTVLSQTPSGQVVVAERGREESADLRSMRMGGFSHRVCAGSCVVRSRPSRRCCCRYGWGTRLCRHKEQKTYVV